MIKQKNVWTFFRKCIWLLLPFVLLVFIYIVNDPFLVLRSYKDYDHTCVALNESTVGWFKYKKFRRVAHYDSFILGNSCSMAYLSSTWEKYIHGSSLRFFGNGEGIVDVYNKLAALDRQKDQPIKNLLIVMDNATLRKSNQRINFMYIMPPEVSHISEVKFQMEFLQGFFNPAFIVPYLDFNIFHTYRKYMNGVINPNYIAHLGVRNDAINPNERKIELEGEAYWKQGIWLRKHLRRRNKCSMRAIFNLQRELLCKIKNICTKHHTDVRIIINPDYKQVAFNPEDLNELKIIFGANRVFNFSGVNRYTADKHNFYDLGHYRYSLGNEVLRIVYHKDTIPTNRSVSSSFPKK